MMRPKGDANAQAGAALRQGAISLAKEMFEFLEGLGASHLEAFWPSCGSLLDRFRVSLVTDKPIDSRTNFTIASNFMVQLFVTSPNVNDATECLHLLGAWRGLLRIKSRSCDLLNLALLRLDATYVLGLDRLIDLSPSALQAFQEQTNRS